MVNYLAYRVKKLPKSLQFLMWTARVKRWSYKPAQRPTSSLGARLWCRSPDCPSSLLQWQNPHAFAALGCTGGRQGASALGGCRRPVLLWKKLHCLLHALRRQKLKVALSPLYSRWRTRSPWRYTPPRFSTSSLAWGRIPLQSFLRRVANADVTVQRKWEVIALLDRNGRTALRVWSGQLP